MKAFNLGRLQELLSTQKQILTVDDLVAYTGLSKSDIYHKVQQRKIPFSRPNGKLLFFNKQKIDEWLLSNPVEPFEDTEQLASAYVANNPLKGGRP